MSDLPSHAGSSIRPGSFDTAALERREFWLTREQSEQMPIRDRSAAGAGADKAAMLPPMEIVAAAELIVSSGSTFNRPRIR